MGQPYALNYPQKLESIVYYTVNNMGGISMTKVQAFSEEFKQRAVEDMRANNCD